MADDLPFALPTAEDVLRKCTAPRAPRAAWAERQQAVRRGFRASNVRLGDLEVREELGRGSYGVVYRAAVRDNPALARLVGGGGEVALKCLYNHDNVSTRSMRLLSRGDVEPLREAEPHPCVLTQYWEWEEKPTGEMLRRLGNGGTHVFVVSELFPCTLERVEAEAERLWREARHADAFWLTLSVAVDVARGLQHVHERLGRVHLDLKPENVLIGGDGRAAIADLGCSMTVADMAAGDAAELHGNTSCWAPELLRLVRAHTLQRWFSCIAGNYQSWRLPTWPHLPC